MDSREVAKEYRRTHWAGVIQERIASGMSIKAYCKSIGLHENVYYYWQRKLREAACEELGSALPAIANNNKQSIVPSGWAVCGVEEDEPKGSITIAIGKSRISVEANTNPELLEKTCRVLMSLC